MKSRIGRAPLFILVLAAAALAGCAQIKHQAFNADAAPHMKRVVITQAQNQDEYEINIVGHPGMSFGLVGGLIAAADMSAKAAQLTKAVDPQETRLQERFGRKLADRLQTVGYETEVVVLPKDTKEDQAFALARQKPGSDATLLVELHAGYWAAGPSTDYFPRILAHVKAVDAKSDKVLYEDTITYGYSMPQGKTVHFPSEPAYRFKNIDALVSDPARTREGLYSGLDVLAQQIANDIKKQ